jgi:hypothetical protein
MWLPHRLEVFLDTATDVLQKLKKAVPDANIPKDQQGNEKAAGIIATAVKEAAADVPQFEKTQRHEEYKLQERIFFATVAAGAVAAVVGVVAFLQWQEMVKATYAAQQAAGFAGRALRENQRQFQLTSKSNADQFDKTLKQMSAQTEAQQKQLLAFEKSQGAILRIRPEPDADHSKVTFSLKNVGHSAALKMATQAAAVLTPLGTGWSPDPQSLKKFSQPLSLNPTGPALGDGEEYKPPFEINIEDKAEVIAEHSRQQTRVVYLTVTYADIFGNIQTTSDCVFTRVFFRKFVAFTPCPRAQNNKQSQK